MLTLTLVSLFITLISTYLFFAVSVKGLAGINEHSQEEMNSNALIEPFFLQIEHQVARLRRQITHNLYTMLVRMLDRFVPWFRKFTKSFETRLLTILQTLRGKRELNYLGRDSASQFVQDMRNHSEESRKDGGEIV